jgi:two-component system LytT family response regulator
MAAKPMGVHPAFPSASINDRRRNDLVNSSPGAMGEHKPTHYLERILVRSAGRVVFVRTSEVEWCQACENYIQIHLGPQCHLVRGTMAQLEIQLDPMRFVRISRSAIINLDFVTEIRSVPAKGRIVRLASGAAISVGREYRAKLKMVLDRESL